MTKNTKGAMDIGSIQKVKAHAFRGSFTCKKGNVYAKKRIFHTNL